VIGVGFETQVVQVMMTAATTRAVTIAEFLAVVSGVTARIGRKAPGVCT
jgi:hypothetical protein